MRERQKTDQGSAGVLLARAGEQRIEGPGIGSPRKEPITIDEIEQRHRFAAQGVDHVAIIDDMAMFAVRLWSPPFQGEDVGRAQKAVEPVVIEAQAQLMADQPRGHGVEHLAQGEGAGGGDVDMGLLVIGGLALRQVFQFGPLLVDPLGVASIAAPDDLVDEPPPAGKIVEVARGAQQKGVVSALFKWPCELSIEPFS